MTNDSGSAAGLADRVRAPDGTLGAAGSPGDPPLAGEVDVFMQPNGQLTTVFRAGQPEYRGIYTTWRLAPPDGRLTGEKTVEGCFDICDAVGVDAPQVAATADGAAVFVWRRFIEGSGVARTRVRWPSGSFDGPPVSLSAAGHDVLFPQVGIDDDADATYAWTRFDGTNRRIEARTRSSMTGTVGPLMTLSSPGRDANAAHLVTQPDGTTHFAWTRFDGVGDRVQTRTLTKSGTLLTTTDLSASGQPAKHPRIAANTSGPTAVTWTRHDATHWRAQVAIRP